MALMKPKLTDLIAKLVSLGRIYRYAYSGLRFMAKSGGFASALRQKLLKGGSDACRRRERQLILWPANNANNDTNQRLMKSQIMPKHNRT